jgi:hypothetical protein
MNRTATILFISLILFGCTSNQEPKSDSFNVNAEKRVTPLCGEENDAPTLGIGLVSASTVIELFHDSLLTKRYVRWENDSSETSPMIVCPKYYFPDYSIFHFICLEQTSTYYKVLVNFNQVKYFPKGKEYVFKSWQEYLTNTYRIRRIISPKSLNTYNQHLVTTPSADGFMIKTPDGPESFCVLEVDGDWIKVTYDCSYFLKTLEGKQLKGQPCRAYIKQCTNPTTGWLKWRNGNKMLIDLALMP